VQLVTVGLLLYQLPVNVQLVTVLLSDALNIPVGGLADSLNIPPPFSAVLPVKMQLVTVGLLLKFHIPPPFSAVLSVKMQLVTVGL